ncbi:hypothetical protein PJ311_09775 [Bacillus sp. CLL-7-23]|uniref:Uncharacterized protein n=1 Tax=Bacillus changyiensis TaxID=3004103 RepID=A0ABT4X3N0_9BACI|nr:hypothetical protein [Bacillus changyiensis]MDA7026895.1 hypothetical protein [Bacillus changyiensis]
MLDFILDNPIMMAIIVGAISLIFNRIGKNDEEEQNKKTPTRSKTQAQKQKPKRQHKQDDKPSAQTVTKQQTSDVMAELNRIKTEAERSLPAVKRAIKKQSSSLHVKENEKLLNMNKNTVVQGIVLGEVFGPPRSKKPHYTMRRRSKN